MKCDFCGRPSVEWWYPCIDFDVDAITFHEKGNIDGPVRLLDSTGEWGACEICSRYIERKDYFFLAQRISREQNAPQLFGPIHSLFNEFERMRSGERFRRQETLL